MSPNKSQKIKSTLRQRLLTQRGSLSESQWRKKSDRLCQHLQTSGLLKQNNTILAYFSTRREPDLSRLFQASASSYRWGFPRCQGKELRWHEWSPADAKPLQTSRYGITEPHPDAPQLDASRVDLMLVPAIACDHRGYRLGYGGGFYDRLLALPAWAAMPTVGIVFAEALLLEVPTEPWDKPLQMVCTDRGLLKLS